MIHVIAWLKIKPGQFDAFVKRFKQLVPEVLAESGCIAYAPTIDVATGIDIQKPTESDVLTVVEQWESIEALRTHLEAPHVKVFFDDVGQWLESCQIIATEPA